jgi:hypothetical protein
MIQKLEKIKQIDKKYSVGIQVQLKKMYGSGIDFADFIVIL